LQPNEQEYWPLIHQGDKVAFEKVFRLYYQPLCNYAGPLLKDFDEAEEVVQNVFYTIWNKRETMEVHTSVKAYLYRAVHNDCLNKLKHRKVKQHYAEAYQYSASVAEGHGANSLLTKELGQKIEQAIESLPEQCGQVFKLSRFEQLKYSEIAEQMGLSVKTVENHMGRALKLLREKLKDYLPLVMWLLYLN